MEPSIVVSILSMALTATVAYIGAQRGVAAKLAALDAKVDMLTGKVEKHNGAMERLAALEARIEMAEKLESRIETIEKEMRA